MSYLCIPRYPALSVSAYPSIDLMQSTGLYEIVARPKGVARSGSTHNKHADKYTGT